MGVTVFFCTVFVSLMTALREKVYHNGCYLVIIQGDRHT